MTQEEKMLLIKDLSARLPYAVTVEHTSGFRGTLHDITVHHMYDDNDNIHDAICYTDFFGDGDGIYIEYFKPYLFPLSSMTEEQMFDFATVQAENCKGSYPTLSECSAIIDWGYKHHFDVNSLIEKGLALDATNKNIY
jgi:hypothetical protein